MDLAEGHVKALKKFEDKPAVYIYNLGTGHGYSVLDVIHAFSKAVGKRDSYVIKPRRAGDIAACYSDATKAKEELGWEAKRTLDDMCGDHGTGSPKPERISFIKKTTGDLKMVTDVKTPAECRYSCRSFLFSRKYRWNFLLKKGTFSLR